jgi:hypothetical protein
VGGLSVELCHGKEFHLNILVCKVVFALQDCNGAADIVAGTRLFVLKFCEMTGTIREN